jgi:hypothetical protein
LLDDIIINPIPILQRSFLDHQSTLGNKGTTIAKLLPSFSFFTPTITYTHLMDATMTSFHIPYSCWPLNGVTINENHHNFHVNGN